jgi:hypothetical protein
MSFAMDDLINIGAAPNDRTGDDFRAVCIKVNGVVSDFRGGKLDTNGDGSNLSGVAKPADVAGKLDATVAALGPLLLVALDSFPWLPADPANYPAQGGLFRDGDANGYRLVRIFPAS